MPQFGGAFVVGLLLLGFLLFGIELCDAAVGVGIFFVDFYCLLVVSDGFAEFVLLSVGAADEPVGFALARCDAGGSAVEGNGLVVFTVVEVDVAQAVVGRDVGAVVSKHLMERLLS